MPLFKECLDVPDKYLRIEPCPGKRAADEEGTTFSEDVTHGPKGQVCSRSDPGDMHMMIVEHLGEDKIIYVALVGGYIDDSSLSRPFSHPGQPAQIHIYAFKDPFPDPSQSLANR